MTNDMSMWKAGTASIILTPDEPLWLAGYAARSRPAEGKVSDLFVSALVLEDNSGQRLAIASADLIAIPTTIAGAVIAAVQRQTGIPRERIILAASHTHYGPEVRPDKATFFHIPPTYGTRIEPFAQRVIETLTRTIASATDAMVPVRVFARLATAGFAHNRRRSGAKGDSPSADDITDPTVNILDVVHASTGVRSAIVFGYACHNTTLPPDDCRYCADWAGFARLELERRNDRSTALFVAGCGADQNPEPRGTIELSRHYGFELADAVHASLLRGDGIELTGAIDAAMEDLPLIMKPPTLQELDAMLEAGESDPPQKVKARFLLDQLSRGRPLATEYAVPVQAIRLGDQLLWIALAGEPVVDWSFKLKRACSTVAPVVWISGYCNDMPGYLPTRRIMQEGGYEGGRANLWSPLPSFWTDDVEDRISAAVDRLVKRLD